MDNQEPELTQIANAELLHTGHKLPEQSRVPNGFNVNQTSFNDIIHQWQPMGIRVNLNLPFTGNDKDFLFAIRNGPFIPQFDHKYSDYVAEYQNGKHTTSLTEVGEYAYNNMMPVSYAYAQAKTIQPDKSAIFITHYDQPPPLASFATMFRKWRGAMHYRIRVVAGFTTQGYVFTTMYRNVRRPPMIVDRSKFAMPVIGQDSSYRQGMVNSYVMGDTAMFRHFEVQVPFEYPQPYYDQFNWIANRTRPSKFFEKIVDKNNFNTLACIYNEPFGDNFVLFGLRGKLESSVSGSQISFELEYRAGDDFQFSDPFLPIDRMYTKLTEASDLSYITSPSNDWFSDGYKCSKSSQSGGSSMSPTLARKNQIQTISADDMTQKLLAVRNQEIAQQREEELKRREEELRQREEQQRIRDEADRLARAKQLQAQTAARSRKPRSTEDEGQDEVDPVYEEHKPLRKSLRDVLNF